MTNKDRPSEIEIIFNPHAGQRHIIENRKRFNCLNLGRRWGKTYLATYFLLEAALKGKPVAWYSPSYKDLHSVWTKVKRKLEPLIKNKSEQLKSIELFNGVVIDFWSLDDPDNSRGRRYSRAIVDEVAKIRNFNQALNQTIRPCLSDFMGDLFLLSTPKGKTGAWYDVCQSAQLKENWAYFEMPTSTNPYIPKEEIVAAKNDLPDNEFRQEYLATFVDFTDSSWFTDFSYSKHVKHGLQLETGDELILGFDFNFKPATVSGVVVRDGFGIDVLFSYEQDGGTQLLLDNHCGWIRDKYHNHEIKLRITGDNNGWRNDSARGMGLTDYEIIEDFFRCPVDPATRTANATHSFSKTIVNRVLRKCNVRVDAENCKPLIKDFEKTKTKIDGYTIDKANYDCHSGDNFRYIINTIYEDVNDVDLFYIRMVENYNYLTESIQDSKNLKNGFKLK